MTTTPKPIDWEACYKAVSRHNAVIQRADARIAQLQAAGVFGGAREMAQGVEIKIVRPCFKKDHVSISYEIIPW